MKFTVNKKTLQIIALLGIVGMIVFDLFTDFKRDFYDGFLYNIFTEENAEKTCKEMDGEIFEIKDNGLLPVKTNENHRHEEYAEKLISKPNGAYYKGFYCYEKKEKNIYCVSTIKLLKEKLKITRHNVSYLPYLVLILLITIILSRFLTEQKIDLELFCLILLEQIFNFTFLIGYLGFNVHFDNCYTSIPFYFYLFFLLLQFFAIKREKLYYAYFAIIYLGVVITFSFYIWQITRGIWKFDLYNMQLIIISVAIGRHAYRIANIRTSPHNP